jgi:HPt (histidine-containing phosphotransfer) domain-containing protein
MQPVPESADDLPTEDADSPAASDPRLSSAATAGQVGFNRATMLARLDGDEGLLAQLVAFYRQDAPDYLAKTRQAIAKRDVTLLAFSAHRLAGLFRNFALDQDARLALLLETYGQAADFAQANALFPVVEQALNSLSDALDADCPPS